MIISWSHYGQKFTVNKKLYNKKAVEYYEEGKILQQQGRLSDAELAYKEAIIINQDYYQAHNNLGSVFLNQGLFEKAYDAYSKAHKLLPNHPMLLNNLGNALELQGEIEQAIGWYNKAISQDPAYVAPMPFNKLPKLFENIRAGQSLHEGEQAFLPFEHNSNI